MQQGVHADVPAELLELLGRGQFAVDQQVGGFGEVAALGDHFHRIAAVAEDALFAVQEGDGAAGGTGVGVAFVQGDVAGGAEQLADIQGPIAFGALHKGQFVGFIVDCEFCGSSILVMAEKGNDYFSYME